MTDTEAFLRKIRENPDDDAPRLVFADYLDEQAQNASGKEAKESAQWAGIIRCQIAELDKRNCADPRMWNQWAGIDYDEKCKPARELMPKGFQKGLIWGTNRGFFDELDVPLKRLVQGSKELLESVAPLQKLSVRDIKGKWNQIVANPVLSLFRELDVGGITQDEFKSICNDSQFKELTNLNLWQIEADLLPMLNTANFPTLRTLSIHHSTDLKTQIELLEYPTTTKLERFYGQTSVRMAQAISNAPLAKTLKQLVITPTPSAQPPKKTWGEFHNLASLNLTVAGKSNWVRSFLECQNWERITCLYLNGANIPQNVLSYFQGGNDNLELHLCNFSRPQYEYVLSSPTLNRVQVLSLWGQHIEYGIQTLSLNEAATNLRGLEFGLGQQTKNQVDFVKTLCTSPVFANLFHFETSIKLSFNSLKKLAGSPVGQSLRSLCCDHPDDPKRWQELLRDTSIFPKLVNLSFGSFDFGNNCLPTDRKKLKLT